MTVELLESYVALRPAIGIAIAKANVLAVCRHGSPVRLDVIQSSAIALLSNILSELEISHTVGGLGAACERRQTGIAIWREFRENPRVEKVGPAIFQVNRSHNTVSEIDLDTAVLEISELLDMVRKFPSF
jgi:hypothetical protein